MRLARGAALATLLLIAPIAVSAQNEPIQQSVTLAGKVKQPGPMSLDVLKKLPVEQVPLQAERGGAPSNYAGPSLWAVLQAAGGLDDADKSAPLHHTIKIAGRDGYFVVVSTGEVSPEFGNKPAIIAYQRDDKALGADGFRLVLQGDKRNGRAVRDVATITVE